MYRGSWESLYCLGVSQILLVGCPCGCTQGVLRGPGAVVQSPRAPSLWSCSSPWVLMCCGESISLFPSPTRLHAAPAAQTTPSVTPFSSMCSWQWDDAHLSTQRPPKTPVIPS